MKILSYVMLSSLIFLGAAQAASNLLIQHKVTDYPKWREAFDAHKSKQLEAGLTNPRVYFTDGDNHNVSILFDASDEAKAKAFTESKDLKSTMQAAGVQGKPEMHILSSPAKM
jgi:hypothetical protein